MPAKKKTVTAETEAEVITTSEEEVKPVKKTRKTTKKAAEETAEEKPAKKTTRKTAAKKTAEETAEEKPAKKTTRKTTKKAAEETGEEKPAKKTTRKTTAKKTAKKAAEVVEEAPVAETPAVEEAPVVEKKSAQDYEDIINWKKGEAHAMDWLYIEINAQDLLTEVEAGVENIETVCAAMLNTMLEGDGFMSEEEAKNTAGMTVRYYTDNLSPERKKFFEN